jgi:transcriptional regulator with XRE-family HTH domain
LLIEARRRAGLSQRELAARAGVSQQEIARYERARVTPSLERLRQLIAACGLELTFGLARADSSYDEPVRSALKLAPAQRLAVALRDAEPVRAARAATFRTPVPARFDPRGTFEALAAADARYVLVGELAEVLRGSPLLPLSATVTIVPRPGEHGALQRAIAISRGRELEAPSSQPGTERWWLAAFDAELAISPAPPGTYGYDDLRRDATPLRLSEDTQPVPVASLVDLVRIAEAGADRARVPALRRTLELAGDGQSERSVRAA